MATLLTDRFGIDYSTLVSPPSPGGVHPSIDLLFDALSSVLSRWYEFDLRQTYKSEPSRDDGKKFYRWHRYWITCRAHDSEDRSLPKLTIRAHPADRSQGAFRISITTPTNDLLDMHRVREIVSAITTATIGFFPLAHPNRFFRIGYLEATYDQPTTQANFWTLLNKVHVPYLRAGGVDLWPYQDYVQWGRRTGSRFAAMYAKYEQLLTFLRIECKLRRKRLQYLGVRWFDDLFHVDLAPLFHVQLPDPLQTQLMTCIREFERTLRCGPSSQTGSRAPEVQYVPVTTTQYPAGAYVAAVRSKLLGTHTPKLIKNRIERLGMRAAFTDAERVRFIGLARSTTVAPVLATLDADPLALDHVKHLRAALQRHVAILSTAADGTENGNDWCVFTVLLDAALQAKEAVKRYGVTTGPITPAPATTTHTISTDVTNYVSLLRDAVYATACTVLWAA